MVFRSEIIVLGSRALILGLQLGFITLKLGMKV